MPSSWPPVTRRAPRGAATRLDRGAPGQAVVSVVALFFSFSAARSSSSSFLRFDSASLILFFDSSWIFCLAASSLRFLSFSSARLFSSSLRLLSFSSARALSSSSAWRFRRFRAASSVASLSRFLFSSSSWRRFCFASSSAFRRFFFCSSSKARCLASCSSISFSRLRSCSSAINFFRASFFRLASSAACIFCACSSRRCSSGDVLNVMVTAFRWPTPAAAPSSNGPLTPTQSAQTS
mmetsp:Transcript_43764/g.95270  ORF Transcript_43764/g.95270 Transcript_43764/m.95270 type:complete len:237 (+) Transcript_43764:170-880(+)